jgi:hypothetical protein
MLFLRAKKRCRSRGCWWTIRRSPGREAGGADGARRARKSSREHWTARPRGRNAQGRRALTQCPATPIGAANCGENAPPERDAGDPARTPIGRPPRSKPTQSSRTGWSDPKPPCASARVPKQRAPQSSFSGSIRSRDLRPLPSSVQLVAVLDQEVPLEVAGVAGVRFLHRLGARDVAPSLANADLLVGEHLERARLGRDVARAGVIEAD